MSRSSSRALQTAFGQAQGSTNSLAALAGGMSPAPSIALQSNGSEQLQHQPQHQQQQVPQQQAPMTTRQGSTGHTGSHLLGRAASTASSTSFDAVAAAAYAGLPGVAEGSSSPGAQQQQNTANHRPGALLSLTQRLVGFHVVVSLLYNIGVRQHMAVELHNT